MKEENPQRRLRRLSFERDASNLAALEVKLEDMISHEGLCCPEDLGFAEYIKMLQAETKRLREDVEFLYPRCAQASSISFCEDQTIECGRNCPCTEKQEVYLTLWEKLNKP